MKFCLLLLETTHLTLKAEKVLQRHGVRSLTLPKPRHLSSSCGLVIRVKDTDRQQALKTLEDNGITAQVYDCPPNLAQWEME